MIQAILKLEGVLEKKVRELMAGKMKKSRRKKTCRELVNI